MMADILIEKIFRKPVFSWGDGIESKKDQLRSNYIAALKEADNSNIRDLLKFARS